jgi:hypothetical protein
MEGSEGFLLDAFDRLLAPDISGCIPFVDAGRARDGLPDVVEVVGETGCGKTTLLLASVANVLHASETSAVPTAIDRPTRVLWVDCDGKFRAEELFVQVLGIVAAADTASGPGPAPSGTEVLARVRRMVSRVDVLRLPGVHDIAEALERASGTEKGRLAHRPSGEGAADASVGEREGAEGEVAPSGRPALVVLDGLGTLLWEHARPRQGRGSVFDVERLTDAMQVLSVRYQCPVLWSRQVLFKLGDVPRELRGTAAAASASEALRYLSHAVSSIPPGTRTPAVLACIESVMALLPERFRDAPVLTVLVRPEDAPPRVFPAWPCSWQPSGGMRVTGSTPAYSVLHDTAPRYLRDRTRASIFVTRLPTEGAHAAGGPVSRFLLRWVADDFRAVPSAQTLAVGAAGQQQAGAGGRLPVVWECAMMGVTLNKV